MLSDIKYICPNCGFSFSLCFDPEECTADEIKKIESCPCGTQMVREKVMVLNNPSEGMLHTYEFTYKYQGILTINKTIYDVDSVYTALFAAQDSIGEKIIAKCELVKVTEDGYELDLDSRPPKRKEWIISV